MIFGNVGRKYKKVIFSWKCLLFLWLEEISIILPYSTLFIHAWNHHFFSFDLFFFTKSTTFLYNGTYVKMLHNQMRYIFWIKAIFGKYYHYNNDVTYTQILWYPHYLQAGCWIWKLAFTENSCLRAIFPISRNHISLQF